MNLHNDPASLTARAHEIPFAEAVTRLARLLGAQRPVGTTGPIEEERILFRPEPSLGFPANDVAAVRLDSARPNWPAEMEVTFLGLYGPSSPLPPAWTERIVMEADGADNLRDLLDLFDHPLIALAYRVWRHYRLDLHFDRRAQDPGSRAALALAGMFVDEGAADPDLDPLRLLPLAGLLAQHARSAELLRRLVSEYFGVPVVIEEWVKRMAPIPEDQQFRFAAAWVALGSTTILGEAVPDVAGTVTIVIGPLSPHDFDDFLPGGGTRATLHALLRLAVREPVECLVDLVLADDAPAGLVLGAGRLGWTTWQDAPGVPRRCPTGAA